MAAALSAAHHGLDVLVCEKAAQLGGTSATSGGTLWVPGNRHDAKRGTDEAIDAARRYLDAVLPDGLSGRELREAYLRAAPGVIDWFETNTEVKFASAGRHPDYLDLEGAAASGRALSPLPFDGRLLGEHFARVRAPIPEFLVLGGMMVGRPDIHHLLHRYRSLHSFAQTVRLVLRYATDRLRHARGTRLVMGNALAARMYWSLLRKAVPIVFEAPLGALERDGARVVGAWIGSGVERRLVRTRRGVVLATGGFARNAVLRARFMRPAVGDSLALPENTGDGVGTGLAVGALARPELHARGAFWTPVSRTGSGTWAGLYPHLVMDRAKPGLIAVNAAGERFVNEAVSYHHFVEAMFASHERVATIPAWLVCEAAFVRKYGLGAIRPGTRDLAPYESKEWVTVARTLEALATRIGVDPEGLVRTVARHNGFARSGVDEDFGKGGTVLNRHNGDPGHRPNPCIGPVATGPFCAMAVWPAELGCSTGLEVDANARVLDTAGLPIAGLYAAGNDLASIMRGTYPGPGTTLGPALVFGWLAGRDAARPTAEERQAVPTAASDGP